MFLADSGETAWIDRRAKPDVRPGRRTLGDALVYVYCLFFFGGGGGSGSGSRGSSSSSSRRRHHSQAVLVSEARGRGRAAVAAAADAYLTVCWFQCWETSGDHSRQN